VILLQAGLDESGVLGGVWGIHGRESGRDPNVGNHYCEVLGGNLLPNNLFHPLDELFSFFETSAGWGFHVDDKLAGVGSGKVGDAQQWKESEAKKKNADQSSDGRQGSEQ